MAINEETVAVAQCNGCGNIEYSLEGVFRGIYGTVHVPLSDGGHTASFYSCSKAPGHIGKAVRSAIDAGSRGENGDGAG